MLKWFNRFKRRIPKQGELWTFKDDSPWPNKFTVRILEVKEGWVRYWMSQDMDDNRLKLSTFISLYEVSKDA